MNTATFLLTINEIKQWCGSTTIYNRGDSYFREGRVNHLAKDPTLESWYAEVSGSEDYEVFVDLFDDQIRANCECPAFYTYDSCKHIVAVLLEIEQKQRKLGREPRKPGFAQRKYNQASQMMHTFDNELGSEQADHPLVAKELLSIEFICSPTYSGTRLGNRLISIELKAGLKRPYVVKDLSKFLQCIENHSEYVFTSKFTYDPSEHEFMAEDREIMDMLQEVRKQAEFYRDQMSHFYSRQENERSLLVPPMMADRLLAMLLKRSTTFEGLTNVSYQHYSDHHKLPFHFRLEKGSSGDYQLDLTSLQAISYYESYGWIFQEGSVYKLSPVQKELFKSLSPFIKSSGESVLPVAPHQMGRFVSTVIPKLKRIGQMELAEQVSEQIMSPPLQSKVFIDQQDEQLIVKLEYHYGPIVMDPFQNDTHDEAVNGVILMREMEKEQEIMAIIERIPFQFDGKTCHLKGEEEIYDFLFTSLPQLEDRAEIFLTHAVKSLILLKPANPLTKVDIDSGGNLLEIRFDMEGIEREQVNRILQSVVEKKKFYRLPSGAFVSLEVESFQKMSQLFEELHIQKTQVNKGVLQLPVYRGLQIDDIMSGGNPYAVKLGKKFRSLIQDLKNPDNLDYELPSNLCASLRDYQQIGFQWLKTMAHYRLGGILADDMGLGKTLQAIAYLLSEKTEHPTDRKTSLVVCPASLVYNWKNEFEKFAPDLDVVVAYGTPEERYGFHRDQKPDVFITSYPLLRQDLEFYEKVEFDSLILDEAQAIKNHMTKTAKAVKEIQAVKRFALSGTPIENSLDELWSIFDAILPGFFQNQSVFKKLEPDRISRMVRPFVLRRLKQEVLKELPDKIETVQSSELTKKQKELYLAYLEKIQHESKDSIQAEGFDKSRMKILAGLTRLRQLCCHPALFIEDYHGQSGKLEQLQEIMENALENKRRLLVFSQFTSMLQIIREELDRGKTGYFYLDGQTPSKERVDMAERFNHGEKDVFLISLKAGGTGLNLTGADTVILYDLWWNPAIEEQAAGRAHRMGQKNSVQVMRLIARGTIEEKMYEMQQKKKELFEQVLQPGETTLSSFSEEEIRELLGI